MAASDRKSKARSPIRGKKANGQFAVTRKQDVMPPVPVVPGTLTLKGSKK